MTAWIHSTISGSAYGFAGGGRNRLSVNQPPSAPAPPRRTMLIPAPSQRPYRSPSTPAPIVYTGTETMTNFFAR